MSPERDCGLGRVALGVERDGQMQHRAIEQQGSCGSC